MKTVRVRVGQITLQVCSRLQATSTKMTIFFFLAFPTRKQTNAIAEHTAQGARVLERISKRFEYRRLHGIGVARRSPRVGLGKVEGGEAAGSLSQPHVSKRLLAERSRKLASCSWIPVLSSQAYETSLRNDDVMEVRRLETTKTGNVSAIISFSLKTICQDDDFRRYPDDQYRCCKSATSRK